MELHLVSRRADQRAWEFVRARSGAGAPVEVVLIHDAVLETEATIAVWSGAGDHPQVVVMACAADARRRQVEERWALIDYDGMIARCSLAEKVTTW